MAYALRRAHPDDAEDVVAETFLVAWRRFDSIPSEPLPWLLGVARKVMSTKRRSITRRAALEVRLRDSLEASSSIVTSSDRLSLIRAFTSLREADREVLMLVGWDGLSASQAAQVLGCSQTSFSLRLHRARKRLERLCEEETPPFLTRHVSPTPEEAP
jgi:RNA polymerase sigma factor (sigma-70 family)